MNDKKHYTAIDDLVEEDEDLPNIEEINENIVSKRLMKFSQVNEIFSKNYDQLILTCIALKDHNLECSKKYEKLEKKYIQK